MIKTTHTASIALLASSMAIAVSSIMPAEAASAQESRYTYSECDESMAKCGVIVAANGGTFTLDWASITARGDQPASSDITHEKCTEGLERKLKDDVPSGNYDTFVLPASCAYKLKIKILGANSKDQNFYLTPGCQIIATVKGSASNNSWKGNKVSGLSSQVPTVDGKPVDAGGYKCGKQSSAGF